MFCDATVSCDNNFLGHFKGWGDVENSKDYRDYTLLEMSCRFTELSLNVIGYIPILSLGSATIRALYATVQIVAGIAFGILSNFISLFSSDTEKKRFIVPFKYAFHGVLNFQRALIETVLIVGNVGCFLYDWMGYRVEY